MSASTRFLRAQAAYACVVVAPSADLSSQAVHARARSMYRAAAMRAARRHDRPSFSWKTPSATARAVVDASDCKVRMCKYSWGRTQYQEEWKNL